MEFGQTAKFTCRFCKRSFSQVQNLYKHVQQVHTASPPTKSSRTCPICGIVFGIGGKNESYRTHLRHIHGQRNEGQTFAFKCFNDFFLWKTELEKRTACKYGLQSAPKVLPTNEKIHVYQCDYTKQVYRKKKKFNITEPICPAMVCATESLKDLEIKVDYWNTHVGHSVQIEQDELNAAICSVQDENHHAQVMDMLNSIGQGTETGAEEFVTETVEGEDSTSSFKGIQRNMFDGNKNKSPKTSLSQSTQFVPNFSFKKDPSKKKESSIYSLASVACGKVSANKLNINKSASAQFQDLVKNIAKKNSGTIINNKSASSSNKKEESDLKNDEHNFDDPFNDIDTTSSSNKKTNTKDVNNTSIGGRFVAINPMPEDKSISDKLSVSNEVSPIVNSSVTSVGKSISDKENVSLISNKIDTSVNKTASQSLLKNNSKTSENITVSSKKEMLNLKAIGIIGANNTPKIIQCSDSQIKPLTSIGTPLFRTGTSTFPAIIPNSNLTSQAASPLTQTYLSINNKLIPVGNTLGTVVNPNLNSNIILSSSLPQLATSQINPAVSLSNSKTSIGGSKSGGFVVAGNTLLAGPNNVTSPLAQSASSPPVVLIPYPNNSAIPSVLQSKPSAIASSPLVLQSVQPMSSLSTKSLPSTSLLKNSPVTAFLPVATAKNNSSSALSLAKIGTSLYSTNAVKVQKVSLPSTKGTDSVTTTVSSIPSITKVLTDSKVAISQPLTNTVTSKASPVTSSPNINISKVINSKTHKPGTFVFESAGELFMLEPVDDDLIFKSGIKGGTSLLTSTPKKQSEISKTETQSTLKSTAPAIKRKSAVDYASKSKKLKEDTLKEYLDFSKLGLSAVYDASTKSAHVVNKDANVFSDSFDGDSNSCTSSNSVISKDSSQMDSKKTSDGTVKLDMDHSVQQKKESAAKSAEFENYKKEVALLTSLPEDKKKIIQPPFLNLIPLKSPTSVLTVKTVPSFSIPQSRPVSSFITSTRTQPPRFVLSSSSSNCISSLQNEVSPTKSSQSENKQPVNICDSEPMQTNEDECKGKSEVKRGVTIKSVKQEKRCITDDDLEIMKKVKFYNLEMKYYSCQEESKKLKIELAKALAKNKELMEIIENLKNNKTCTKENVDAIKNNNSNKEKIDNDSCDKPIQDAAIDDKICKGKADLKTSPNPENVNEKSISDTAVTDDIISDAIVNFDMDDIVSDVKPVLNDLTSNNEIVGVSDENSDVSKLDAVSVTNKVISSDEEMLERLTETNASGIVEAVTTPNTSVIPDMNITSEKEMINLSNESSSGKAETMAILDAIVIPDEDNGDKEIIDLSDESCDGDNETNIDETNFYLANLRQNILLKNEEVSHSSENTSGVKVSSEATDSEVVSKQSDLETDVYTMVRTSVLRDLYLDIEDLCREKKKLLEDVEHLKKLQSEIVPSNIV